MGFINRLALLRVTAGFWVVVLAPFPAVAQRASDTTTVQIGDHIRRVPSSASISQAKRYWTSQRLQNAKTVLPQLSASGRITSVQTEEPSGSTVSAPSTVPRKRQPQKALSSWLAPMSKALQALFSFQRYSVSLDDYTQTPEQAVGKLFFTQNGTDYVCSASAVNSTNKRLVWTAGHCVSDGEGNFSTNVLFIPAYQSGTDNAEPYGRWSACQLFTTTAWHQRENYGRDLGAIEACDNSNSEKLHDVVGSLGYLANARRRQTWRIFGYPAESPFDGTRMIACISPFGQRDSSVSPATNGVGCDMTGGSSGGPWLANYATDETGDNVNQINGNTSYGYSDQPNVLYSPYFGNAFVNLRNFAIQNGA